MPKPEEKIHIGLCDYLKYQYPKVLFLSEASGVRTSIGQSVKLKKMRSTDVHLDIYIMEPTRFHGLILEVKAKSVYKKDGTLLKSEHLEDQQKTIDKLNSKGYYATFVFSLDEGIKIIDKYLKGEL